MAEMFYIVHSLTQQASPELEVLVTKESREKSPVILLLCALEKLDRFVLCFRFIFIMWPVCVLY